MKEVRIDVKLGLVGPKKRDAPRTASIEKLGRAADVTPLTVSTTMGPAPRRRNRPGGPPPNQRVAKKPHSAPYPPIAIESPLHA